MHIVEAQRRVAELAVTQHGAFSVAQSDQVGVTARQRRHLLDIGRWDRLAHGVLGLPGHPDSWDRQLWVAHLHSRNAGVVAARSAVLRHGVVTVDVDDGHPNDLITPARAGRALEGTRRFRTDTLLPSEIVTIAGLPTTDPTRTVVDLSEVMRFGRLEASAETFLLDGRTTVAALTATYERLRSPARPGVMMRRLLDVLGTDGVAVGRSELERILAALLEGSGLPVPRWEYPLPTTSAMTGFVDCCWPDVRLIVEADGRRWHDRRQQVNKDRQRDHEAQELGYQTLRFGYSDLKYDPAGSLRTLLRVHAQRVRDAGRAGRAGR